MAEKVMRMEEPGSSPYDNKSFFKPSNYLLRKQHPQEDEPDKEIVHRKEMSNIHRKCAECEEEEKSVHRKEGAGSEEEKGSQLDSYISSLHNAGDPLPESTLNFFEPRFNQDFSNVRVHSDNEASQSAQYINALAYTSGNNIVFGSHQFSPETTEGKKLLAHELTHVIQQGDKRQAVQARPDPVQLQTTGSKPLEGKALEKKLRKDFLKLRMDVDAASPNDAGAKKLIQTELREFVKNFSSYHPSEAWGWDAPDPNPNIARPDEGWRHDNIYSLEEATDLSARLQLIGLSAESKVLYQFGKPTTYIGASPQEEESDYYRDYTTAALERVGHNLSPSPGFTPDLLITAFKYILGRIMKENPDEMMKLIESFKSWSYSGANPQKLAWIDKGAFMLSLLNQLEEIYAGLQRIVQQQMEIIYKELESTGEAPTLPIVSSILQKIDIILAPASYKMKTSPGHESFFPANISASATKSVFNPGGGIHKDFFDDSKHAPSVKFQFYDKNEKGHELMIPFFQLLITRKQQCHFIENFYGLDPKGKKTTGSKSPQDLIPGKHFSLFSLDDWRIYLEKKFEDLTVKQKMNNADAFLTLIEEIKTFENAFTIHTPYNIEDFGDNYLKKTFPRALSGQLIQDCGVYALKTVYLLSLVAPKIGLRFQYIVLPNHVGLIIRGNQTPSVIVHNDKFTVIPLSEEQFKMLSKEHQRDILPEDKLHEYEKTGAGLPFTMEQLVKNNFPDEKHALVSIAANQFVNRTDMPFLLQDIKPGDYAPGLKPGKIKSKLWEGYEKMTRDSELFNPRAINDKNSQTFQFNLRYLALTVKEKNFNNQVLLPYLKEKGFKQWFDLKEQLQQLQHDKNEKGYLQALKDYRKIIDEELLQKYLPIESEKSSINKDLPALKKKLLNRGVSTTTNQADWNNPIIDYMIQLNTRIDNLDKHTETMSGGTNILPPFIVIPPVWEP